MDYSDFYFCDGNSIQKIENSLILHTQGNGLTGWVQGQYKPYLGTYEFNRDQNTGLFHDLGNYPDAFHQKIDAIRFTQYRNFNKPAEANYGKIFAPTLIAPDINITGAAKAANLNMVFRNSAFCTHFKVEIKLSGVLKSSVIVLAYKEDDGMRATLDLESVISEQGLFDVYVYACGDRCYSSVAATTQWQHGETVPEIDWGWVLPDASYTRTNNFDVKPNPAMKYVPSGGGQWYTSTHYGTDWGAASGTNIFAAESGKVTKIDTAGTTTAGKFVEITHGQRADSLDSSVNQNYYENTTRQGCFTESNIYWYRTRYQHMDSISVSLGDSIAKGADIGTVGTTGTVTGAHLHFELFKYDTYEHLENAGGNVGADTRGNTDATIYSVYNRG